MNHVTFDNLVRRAGDLMDRRSLFGGASAALLGIGWMPAVLEAKKRGKGKKKRNRKSDACKKRVKECSRERLPGCSDEAPSCEKFVKRCCKKACKSFDQADRCLLGD